MPIGQTFLGTKSPDSGSSQIRQQSSGRRRKLQKPEPAAAVCFSQGWEGSH